MTWYYRIGYFGFAFLMTLGAASFVVGLVLLVLHVQ